METCKNVGFELWQARKARGWSRAQASSVTKLRIGQIEALESNNFAALPPPVYVRQHLRDYVRELGLDPHELADRYLAQYTRESVNTDSTVTPQATRRAFPALPIARLARVAMVAIIVLVTYLFLNPPVQVLANVAGSDAVQSTVRTTTEQKVEVNASYGTLVERSRDIAIASRLVH